MPPTPINENFTAPKTDLRRDLLCVFGVCLIALCLMLPVWFRGIPMGNDLPQHFQFAVTIDDALQSGEYYPTWMPNENKGYGGIGMRFYPPLGYYVLAFAKMLMGNWFDAAKLVFTFWLMLSGVAAYFWARERAGFAASAAGAAVFLLGPYHLNEIYNAFTYAEFAAVAVLPFSFLFVDRLVRRPGILNFAGLAVSYGLLIVSNIPVSIMGTIALGVYCLASLRKTDLVPTMLRLGGAFGTGALLTAFYWVKVVAEMTWLNHSTESYAAGAVQYDFRNNFLLLFKYVWDKPDERNMWFADEMLLASLGLFVPLLIVFWYSGGSLAARRLRRVLLLCAFTIFMTTPLSTPIWQYISPMQKIQFPWRWMAVASIAAVPLAAAGWDVMAGWLRTSKRPYALIVLGCMIWSAVFTCAQIVRGASHHTREEFDSIVAPLRDAPQNCECWMPVWAKDEAMENRNKVEAGGRDVSDIVWNRREHDFSVAAGEPATARMATYYYPYWQVRVNDSPVKTIAADDGALSFPLPAEQSKVTAEFKEPASIIASKYVSLAVLVLFALLIAFKALTSLRNTKNSFAALQE
jgi:hypothetical protein